MNFIRQIEKFQKLNKLIQEQQTGSPDELAARLGISRRQLYTSIENFKLLGLDIAYSRRLNSFYFVAQKELKIDFNLEVINKEETITTSGGNFINLLPCFYYARSNHNLAV